MNLKNNTTFIQLLDNKLELTIILKVISFIKKLL